MQSWQYLRLNINDYLLKDGGSPMTGNLDMNSNLITNLGTATNPGDAVNKNVMDASLNLRVLKTGGAITGPLYSSSSLDVSGNVLFGSNLNLIGTNSRINLTGANSILDVSGNVFIDGATSRLYLPSTSSRLDVSGNTAMSGSLNVIGTSSQVNLTGANSRINLTGASSVLDVSGNVFIDGASSRLYLSGTNSRLDVSGNTSMTGNLNVIGTNSILNLTGASSVLDVSGNVFIDGTSSRLYLTGTNSRLDVSGNTAMTGNLNVIGTNSQLNLTGASSVLGIRTSSASQPLDVNGNAIIRGTLDMNSNRINNVLDPNSSQDAATKNYVDTQTTNTNYLLKSGGTMTGTLVNNKTGSSAIQNIKLTTDNVDNLYFNSSAIGGNYNPIVQTGDKQIIYTNGNTFDTGALVIGPWADPNGSAKGIRMDNNGNVGIGITSPTQALDVNGNANISNTLYVNTINVDNAIGIGGYINLLGELNIGGYPGTAGQVLMSRGSNSSPVWYNKTQTYLCNNPNYPRYTAGSLNITDQVYIKVGDITVLSNLVARITLPGSVYQIIGTGSGVDTSSLKLRFWCNFDNTNVTSGFTFDLTNYVRGLKYSVPLSYFGIFELPAKSVSTTWKLELVATVATNDGYTAGFDGLSYIQIDYYQPALLGPINATNGP